MILVAVTTAAVVIVAVVIVVVDIVVVVVIVAVVIVEDTRVNIREDIRRNTRVDTAGNIAEDIVVETSVAETVATAEDIAAVSTVSSMTIAVVLRTFPLLPSILGGGNNFVLPIWQRPTAGRDQGRLGMNPEDADE